MFSTMSGALQRWQEDAFGQLQAGGDESFIAGGRVVFAGAVHGFSAFRLRGVRKMKAEGRTQPPLGLDGIG